jgi:hypothetical protein
MRRIAITIGGLAAIGTVGWLAAQEVASWLAEDAEVASWFPEERPLDRLQRWRRELRDANDSMANYR